MSTALESWLRKQPENLNYVRPNGFKFVLTALPKVTYFCNKVNLPAMTFGMAVTPSPFIDWKHTGDKMQFGELTIEFLVQEDFANYTELYNWMVGLGFPDDRSQFAKIQTGRAQTPPEVNGKIGPGEYSDATLIVLDSNNDPIANIIFYECFPISLSSLPFDATISEVSYFQCSATFGCRKFVIDRVDKST